MFSEGVRSAYQALARGEHHQAMSLLASLIGHEDKSIASESRGVLDFKMFAIECMLGARPSSTDDNKLVFLRQGKLHPNVRAEDLKSLNGKRISAIDKPLDEFVELQIKAGYKIVEHLVQIQRLKAVRLISEERPCAAAALLINTLGKACTVDRGFNHVSPSIIDDVANLISLASRLPQEDVSFDFKNASKKIREFNYHFNSDKLGFVALSFEQIDDYKSLTEAFGWKEDDGVIMSNKFSRHAYSAKLDNHFELAGRLVAVYHLADVKGENLELALDEMKYLNSGLENLPWSDITREFELKVLTKIASNAIRLGSDDLAYEAYLMMHKLSAEYFYVADTESQDAMFIGIKRSEERNIRNAFIVSSLMLGQLEQAKGNIDSSAKYLEQALLSLNDKDPHERRQEIVLRTAINYHLQSALLAHSKITEENDFSASAQKLRGEYDVFALLVSDASLSSMNECAERLAAAWASSRRGTPAAEFKREQALRMYEALLGEGEDCLVRKMPLRKIIEDNLKLINQKKFPLTLHFIMHELEMR